MEKCSQHVVLVPYPGQGHLLPIFYLARKLTKHGFAVTIINIDSIHETVSQSWKHDNIRLESIPLEFKVPKGCNDEIMDTANAFIDAMYGLEEPLTDLLTKLTTEQCVCCVISDFFHISAPQAAVRAGIPSVCFWSGAAAWASIQYSHLKLLDLNLVPLDESNSNNTIWIIPGLRPLKAEDLPIYYRKDIYSARAGEKFTPLCMRRVHIDRWILVNSFYELESEVFDAMKTAVPAEFVPIGPLFPLKGADASELEVSLKPESRDSLDWLDTQPPKSVIYISFGSTTALDPEEVKELSQGLEASKQSFLMVIPRLSSPGLDEDFFDKFLQRTRTGMVVGWAPQLAVLQHEAVGGFLTHCGWNSTLESLSSGVPMLGWPRDMDQNTNCKLILEDQGFGIQLRDKTSDGVHKAILSLMNNEELRKKLERVEKDAREAVGKHGSALQSFFNYLKTKL